MATSILHLYDDVLPLNIISEKPANFVADRGLCFTLF